MVAEAREMVALSVAEIPLRRAGDEPGREFTQGEVEALARGGLDLSQSSGQGLARAAARYAALRAAALTEREAAALLGVSESRVRQRVGEGTLYAVRAGRGAAAAALPVRGGRTRAERRCGPAGDTRGRPSPHGRAVVRYPGPGPDPRR